MNNNSETAEAQGALVAADNSRGELLVVSIALIAPDFAVLPQIVVGKDSCSPFSTSKNLDLQHSSAL